MEAPNVEEAVAFARRGRASSKERLREDCCVKATKEGRVFDMERFRQADPALPIQPLQSLSPWNANKGRRLEERLPGLRREEQSFLGDGQGRVL